MVGWAWLGRGWEGGYWEAAGPTVALGLPFLAHREEVAHGNSPDLGKKPGKPAETLGF